jgi:hypothetical protein
MANVKITELTAQTTTADSTDVVPIVDVSADETKKITVANLITAQARTFTAAQRGEITTLTSGATVSWILQHLIILSSRLPERTIDNPTNIVCWSIWLYLSCSRWNW